MTTPEPKMLGPCTALLVREWQRLMRQPSRLIATLGTASLLWFVMASGLAGLTVYGRDYGNYLLPGMASMVVVFASIFGAISLIEDRQEGFLQGVMAGPAPRSALVVSKLLGGASIACVQAALLLAAGPMLGLPAGAAGYASALVALGALGIGISGIALALAWRVNSIAGFHGVMNLVLMPMWLLSGAIFPPDQSAGWLAVVQMCNPVGWPTQAMQGSLGVGEPPTSAHWIGTAGCAAIGLCAAWMTIGRAGTIPRRA
ncbi:MAG: ABC transporter permease [Phycisphaeraceae bacterium]|nr:ABC transporter permease [Phycisphaeraceae bacterium]